MFCPKCGNQLPDGSAFCGRCGNKLPSVPGATPAPGPRPPAGFQGHGIGSFAPAPAFSSAGFAVADPMRIVLTILVVVSLVFTMLPWFEPNSTVKTASYGANMLDDALVEAASWAGINYGGGTFPAFEDSYSPMQFLDLASTVGAYERAAGQFEKYKAEAEEALADLQDSLSGRQRAKVVGLADPQYSEGNLTLQLALDVAFFVWLVGVILLVVGIVLKWLRNGGQDAAADWRHCPCGSIDCLDCCQPGYGRLFSGLLYQSCYLPARLYRHGGRHACIGSR